MELKMNGLCVSLISHPGITLKEYLNTHDISEIELANYIGCSLTYINKILKGKKDITLNIAKKLENVLPNIKASFWLKLQESYDEDLNTIKEKSLIKESELNLVRKNKNIIKYLIDNSYIKNSFNEIEQVLEFRNFLEVNDLNKVPKILNSIAAFRIQLNSEVNEFGVMTWLKICEKECSLIKLNDFASINKEILIDDLNWIRSLSLLEPEEFVPKLQKYFANLGIAFIVTNALNKIPVNGCVKQYGSRINLCLTNRGKDADKFWFTLFHEIGHIIYDDLKYHFVDFEDKDYYESEIVADKFANLSLIDEDLYSELVSNPLTKEAVIEVSKKLNIHPSILVGRLQHDGYLKFNQMNELKKKYIF